MSSKDIVSKDEKLVSKLSATDCGSESGELGDSGSSGESGESGSLEVCGDPSGILCDAEARRSKFGRYTGPFSFSPETEREDGAIGYNVTKRTVHCDHHVSYPIYSGKGLGIYYETESANGKIRRNYLSKKGIAKFSQLLHDESLKSVPGLHKNIDLNRGALDKKIMTNVIKQMVSDFESSNTGLIEKTVTEKKPKSRKRSETISEGEPPLKKSKKSAKKE